MSQPPHDSPDYPWGPPRSTSGGAEGGAGGGAERGAGSGAAGGADPAAAPGPTQPPPQPEPPRYGGASPMGSDQPAGGASAVQLPASDPYGPSDPQAGQHGVSDYGVSQYGTGQYGATPDGGGQYGAAPYAPPAAAAPTSSIVLLIVSGLSVITGILFVPGVVGVILGSIALSRAREDPARARRLTRTGWIVYGVVAALFLIGFVVLIVVLAASLPATTAP